MSKLAKLKAWFSVFEAATHLSDALEETISASDVLRLALDGHLTLSVRFVNEVVAKYGKTLPKNEATVLSGMCIENQEPYDIIPGIPLNQHEVLQITNEVQRLEGVWDLAMIGAEILDVERDFQRRTWGSEVTAVSIAGVFVKGPDGRFLQIQNRYTEEQKPRDFPYYDPNNFYPAESLPTDSELVVRAEALLKFEQSIEMNAEASEKPFSTTERNSLLRIIDALCNYSDIQINSRGTASQIAKLTEENGHPVTDDTIRKVLLQIGELKTKQRQG